MDRPPFGSHPWAGPWVRLPPAFLPSRGNAADAVKAPGPGVETGPLRTSIY